MENACDRLRHVDWPTQRCVIGPSRARAFSISRRKSNAVWPQYSSRSTTPRTKSSANTPLGQDPAFDLPLANIKIVHTRRRRSLSDSRSVLLLPAPIDSGGRLLVANFPRNSCRRRDNRLGRLHSWEIRFSGSNCWQRSSHLQRANPADKNLFLRSPV